MIRPKEAKVPNSIKKTRVCYTITFTASDVALALGCTRDDPIQSRWMSRFCALEKESCTLGPTDALDIVEATERRLRHHRGACATAVQRAVADSLEELFFVFYFPVDRCLNLYKEDCLCPWERRVADIEGMAPFMIETARAYWGSGADCSWMADELENFSDRAEQVSEWLAKRDGVTGPFAADDPSLAARLERVSRSLLEAMEGVRSGKWAEEEWMSVVAVA